MKRTLTVAALVFAAAPLALGQTADSKKSQSAAAGRQQGGVEQTLMQMERDVTAAFLKRDVASIEPLFAPDFAFTGPDGKVQTKAQLLADVKSGDLSLESSDIEDMKVRVYGDAAVVTYSTTDKGKYKGQDIGGKYRWTDVFIRRGGKWQLVAGQGTPIPQPPR
jgi:ketosteroid isomerase-like protein